ELSANIRSTCVKQSTHAATVQNADPTPACAVNKAYTHISTFRSTTDIGDIHSEAAAVQDGHLVVAHLYRLGFVINREKSVLCPKQVTHFLGMLLDSTSMEVRLSQERINAIKTCVRQFRRGQSVSSLRCQRLLGMMASAAIALPLGMLRMRPFQIWYLSMKLNAVTDRHHRVVVSSRCRKALEIWRPPWFLAASGTMGKGWG